MGSAFNHTVVLYRPQITHRIIYIYFCVAKVFAMALPRKFIYAKLLIFKRGHFGIIMNISVYMYYRFQARMRIDNLWWKMSNELIKRLNGYAYIHCFSCAQSISGEDAMFLRFMLK